MLDETEGEVLRISAAAAAASASSSSPAEAGGKTPNFMSPDCAK